MDLMTDEFMRELSNNAYRHRFRQLEAQGYNPTVPSGNFADIWFNAVDLVYPTVARTLTVQSTGNDTDGGTGARTVVINGLNSAWEEISETITLNEATDPTTTNEFIRVNTCFVDEVGTGEVNENNITFTTTTDLEIQANIESGIGQTQKSHYSCPINHKMMMGSWIVSSGKGEDFELRLMSREFGKSWHTVHRSLVYESRVTEHINGTISAKSDVKVMAKSITSNNKPMNCSYDFVLSPDTYL
jgi:hypothetical protein